MNRPIVIADDHPLFRAALTQAVHKVRPAAPIVEAQSLESARAAIAAQSPALLTLDLHMGDSNGFAGLIGIRQDYPALPVIVVSGSEDPHVIARALRFGASAFIPKSADLADICAAIEAVLMGDVWSPPLPANAGDNRDEQLAADRLASLTPAQLRVLQALVEGRLNKQIAYDMSITEATVKAHVTGILRKLHVVSRTQAVIAAQALFVDRPKVSAEG